MAVPLPGVDSTPKVPPTISTLSRDPSSPYWPGMTILVEDDGPPRTHPLLADRDARELAPAH